MPVKNLSDKNCPLKKFPLNSVNTHFFAHKRVITFSPPANYPPAKKVIPVKYPKSANYPNNKVTAKDVFVYKWPQ